MLKRKKRMLSVVLVIVMLVTSMPAVMGSFSGEEQSSSMPLSDPFALMYDADSLMESRLHDMVVSVGENARTAVIDEQQRYVYGMAHGQSAERAELQSRVLGELEALSIESGILATVTELSDHYLNRVLTYHEEFYTDRFIVRFRADTQVNARSSRMSGNASFIETFTESFTEYLSQDLAQNDVGRGASEALVQVFSDQTAGRMELIVLSERVNPQALADELRASGAGEYIEYIQPDFALTLASLDDELVVDSSETSAAAIPSNTNRIGSSVLVAVIDTGIDSSHPMLAGYMVEGWNFPEQNNITFDATHPLASAHGTHIAGIIAYAARNAGADIRIMPLQVFENGRAYTSDIIAAINFAVENGASIINSSFGSTAENPALYEAITNAPALFLCAVGNNRRDMDVRAVYPASYRLPNVISVGSVNADGGLSFFSNYSVNLVDITARGRDIVSTLPNGRTGLLSGTSMSTAYVTGLAVVLLSQSPEMSAAELRERILSSADRLSNLQGTVNAGRRANTANALARVTGSSLTLEPADDFNVHGYQRTVDESWELFSAAGGVVQVTGGGNHSLALMADGTVWAWGANGAGQLGQGFASLVEPMLVQVVGLTGVTYIVAGVNHSFALRADGTLWAWGNNIWGELGDGTRSNQRLSPVQVIGLTDIVAVSAMVHHSLAARADGTVWMWGANLFGQLGNVGSFVDTPVQKAGLTDVVAVAAGGTHNIVKRSDGTVWGWGINSHGQLGNGTTANSLTPVQVNGLSGVVSIAAGDEYSLALRSDGTVWSWGDNTHGQLGDGTTTRRLSPVQVSGLSGVTAIAAGFQYSVAKRVDGTVWSWGSIASMASAPIVISRGSRPMQVDGIGDVALIGMGHNHVIAVRSDGRVWAWGSNRTGQLGQETAVAYSSVPLHVAMRASVTGATTVVHELRAGAGETYPIFLSVDNTETFEGKIFTLSYDATTLTSEGLTHQNNLIVTSSSPGEVVFTIDTLVQGGTVWSGVLALANFVGLRTGQTEIVFTIGEVPVPELRVVRFHFGNIVNGVVVPQVVEVPIELGETVASLGNAIPIPATRYGRVSQPGQAFMGWFTEITPNMHYLGNPNRATAFNLNAPVTAAMFDGDGVLHLHGSWLQYGDLSGSGSVGLSDFLLLQQHVAGFNVNIIMETADVNVDGRVNMMDFGMLQAFIAGHQVILGVPYPGDMRIVRFHFGNIVNDVVVPQVVDVPIMVGQPVSMQSGAIPVPGTRYGRVGQPGQAFMGWFTEITPNMHYLGNPNRATAFNLNALLSATMFDNNGILHLHGSWLQFGDVNGDGVVDIDDILLLRQYVEDFPVNIVIEPADVNVDGVVDYADILLLRQFVAGQWVILGVPEP